MSRDATSMIEEAASGYIGATILFSAFELGLFDALVNPMSVHTLASKIGAGADGVRRLCRVLGAMGLLELRGDLVAPVAGATETLARGGDAWCVVRHHQRHVLPLFLHLTDALRTGERQYRRWSFAEAPVGANAYEELARHPAELATFLAAMDRSSRGVGEALVPLLRERGVARLVDLGCGGGAVAREILANMPEIEIESFDLPAVCAIARARGGAEHAGRHSIAPGDLLAGVDARGADAVLLSGILADFDDGERTAILEGARKNLRPGGHLLLSETLLDEDEGGPMGAAVLSLVMLLAMRGDQLGAAEIRALLERSGFVDVQTKRAQPRDIVAARAR